jgi:putative Mn2+ efflux pump MntP
MQLLYLFIISILNSIDNIGVGVAYSVAGIKVKLSKNILIAFLAFIVSFISSLFGQYISSFFSDEECTIISMLLLVLMGIKMIYTSFSKKKNNNDLNSAKELGYKEAFSVGIALALDDISSSVSSALVGYSAFMVSFPYFVISLAIFFSGNYALKFITKLKVGNKPTIIAGILMILIGISQFFE